VLSLNIGKQTGLQIKDRILFSNLQNIVANDNAIGITRGRKKERRGKTEIGIIKSTFP